MTETMRIPVEKQVIQWAIENGEKQREDLGNKYSLDRWQNPKSDHDYPTFKQLQSFSRDTRIPFNYFFKKTIPNENHTFAKFRTIDNVDSKPSRKLIDTIHQMENKQDWMKQYLIEQVDSKEFALLDKLNVTMSPQSAAETVIELLNMPEVYGVSMSDNDFFSYLREQISSLGIMVMQNGIVGNNTHRNLDVEEFRAFVLIDKVIPLIFINSSDSKKAKIFSLIHEFIHVLLGTDEILNVSPDVNIRHERWINSTTIRVLEPADQLNKIIQKDKSAEDNLLTVSQKFHTSIVASAIRLNELNIYGEDLVTWSKKKQNMNMELKNQSSGGNYYNTAVSRLDRNFATAVISNEASGSIPLAKAASMLGVSLKTYKTTVDKIIGLEQ